MNSSEVYPRYLKAFAVALLTIWVFSPALRHSFVNWDDPLNFLNNPHYRGFTWANLKWMFTDFHGVYIPLSWLSSALDYTFWGMNPAGYHLTNVLIHAANASLVYFLVLAWMSCLRRSDEPGPMGSHTEWVAVFSALFYSIHPLRVESVAWATERRDVLAGFFFLLTLFSYLRSHAQENTRTSLRDVMLPLLFFLLSLLSKASGMLLPFILIVLDIYPLGRLPADPRSWWGERTRKVWVEKVPYLFLAGSVAGVAAFAQVHAGTAAPWQALGLSERLLLVLNSLAFYLAKTVWPFGLSPYYPLPAEIHLLKPPFIWAVPAVLGISLVAFAMRRRWPVVPITWITYVVLVVPTSGVFQSSHQITPDHFSYLPAIVVAWFMAEALWTWGRMGLNRVQRVGCAGIAVVILLGLGFLTRQQVRVWSDSETLWRHVLAINPHVGEAHNNLGTALRAKGRLPEATEEFRRALGCPMVPVSAYNNLGAAVAEQGRMTEAIGLFGQALQADPGDSKARANLDRVLAQKAR